MIDAKTAREKTVMHEDFRNYMDKIEGAVNKAVEKGLFSTSVKHNIEESEKGRMLYGLLNHELYNLGYEFTCKWCESMPASCRSDQWDFNNGYFSISW